MLRARSNRHVYFRLARKWRASVRSAHARNGFLPGMALPLSAVSAVNRRVRDFPENWLQLRTPSSTPPVLAGDVSAARLEPTCDTGAPHP